MPPVNLPNVPANEPMLALLLMNVLANPVKLCAELNTCAKLPRLPDPMMVLAVDCISPVKPPPATLPNALVNDAGMALVKAGNTPDPRVLKLLNALPLMAPVALLTILLNWLVMGKLAKFPRLLVNALLTDNPVFCSKPAPAIIITALNGPPQLIDYPMITLEEPTATTVQPAR
jgi:hypothetical protein